MDEHPGVEIRNRATGPRAGLVGGPDVREVIRAVRSARAAEPTLDPHDALALVASNTGVSLELIDTALHYWMSHPDEIDAWIARADALKATSPR